MKKFLLVAIAMFAVAMAEPQNFIPDGLFLYEKIVGAPSKWYHQKSPGGWKANVGHIYFLIGKPELWSPQIWGPLVEANNQQAAILSKSTFSIRHYLKIPKLTAYSLSVTFSSIMTIPQGYKNESGCYVELIDQAAKLSVFWNGENVGTFQVTNETQTQSIPVVSKNNGLLTTNSFTNLVGFEWTAVGGRGSSIIVGDVRLNLRDKLS